MHAEAELGHVARPWGWGGGVAEASAVHLLEGCGREWVVGVRALHDIVAADEQADHVRLKRTPIGCGGEDLVNAPARMPFVCSATSPEEKRTQRKREKEKHAHEKNFSAFLQARTYHIEPTNFMFMPFCFNNFFKGAR